jgi:DNA repair exonuclease SbcCD nuclease subunit
VPGLQVKQLLVGDMHVVPEELAECERVADLIVETAEREQPDHIVFLGDQYNNHATVHVRAQEFWLRVFDRLRYPLHKAGEPHKNAKVIAIKGNHDLDPTHGVVAHALMAHRHQVIVVEEPLVSDGILFLPYTADAQEFYRWAEAYPDAPVVICHQTFNGCHYENGFYAKDGFDLGRMPQPRVISGHIHAPQVFDKLWYPGAPRWRSAADANTERGIYLVDYDHGLSDAPFVVKRFDTGPVCRRIFHYELTEKDPVVPPVNDKDLVIIDLRGSVEFIKEQQPVLKALGVRVRSHPTTTATISIRESEGIAKSFAKHLDVFTPKFGTEKAVLAQMAQERLGV